MILFAIPFAAFIINDYLFFKLSTEFYALTALRLVLLATLGFVLFDLSKVKSYHTYDKIVFTLALAGILVGGSINLSRLDNYMPQVVIAVIAVLALYLVVPLRLLHQGVLAGVTSVGEAVLVLLAKPPLSIQIYTLFTAIFLANLIGVLISWQFHIFRKRNYQEFVKQQQMQENLEQQTQRLEKIVNERTEQLSKAEKFAAIGENAGMLGHDLRGPLTGISNASYILKKNYSSQLGDEGREMLKIIDESTECSKQMINNLLDYSRNLNLNLAPANISEVVNDALRMVALKPTIKINDEISNVPQVMIDAESVKRVFLNLIGNAVEAMPQGGTLTIRIEKTLEGVRVNISDTGVGISEENKKKLFQPLFTTKTGGTGFGLAICKKIVEAHQGKIYMLTAIGKGTTFTVELPLKTM